MARATMNACAQRTVAGRAPAPRVGGTRVAARKTFSTARVATSQRLAASARGEAVKVQAGVRDGQKLDRKLRIAVVGGGPAGACTAETLAEGGVETVFIERKMDNCKVWAVYGRCSSCSIWAVGSSRTSRTPQSAAEMPRSNCLYHHCSYFSFSLSICAVRIAAADLSSKRRCASCRYRLQRARPYLLHAISLK